MREVGTALFYWWKKGANEETQLVDRSLLKSTLIKLRKRAYSTLREISFIVNHIRTLEGDLEVKKISEIFMRDGGIFVLTQGVGKKNCKLSRPWSYRKLQLLVHLILPRAVIRGILQPLLAVRH